MAEQSGSREGGAPRTQAAHGGLRVQPAALATAGIAVGRAWVFGVSVAMVSWTIVLFGAVHDAYTGFRLGRFDLGNMVQAVWSTAQGRPLEIDRQRHGRADDPPRRHVDPFLVLLAPRVEGLAVAAVAGPRADRGRRARRSARVLACADAASKANASQDSSRLAYLAYPWVATSANGAIHPVTFAITFLLFCVWFLETDRLVPFAMFALLTMSTGELMGLPILALGIWFAFAHGRRRGGHRDRRLGFAWTAFALLVVVPHYRIGDNQFFGFYDQIGGSPQGVLKMLFTHPWTVLGALVEGHDIAYLLWLAVPLLGLFFLSPGLAAVAIAAAAGERPVGLQVDDRSALSQRRSGDPVPHRGDRVRHRAGSALSVAGSPPAVFSLLGDDQPRGRAVGTHRGRDAVRRPAASVGRACRGSRGGGRRRARRSSGVDEQQRRRARLGPEVRLYGAEHRARASGSSST